MKQQSPEERRADKRALYDQLGDGKLTLAESVRAMRLSTGMSQADFAERVAGISRTALAQLESGRGNPRLATLQKVGRAFGLEIAFVRRANQ